MLSIKLKGPHAAAPRVTVLLDDAELAPESLLVPRAVNPGKHTLVLRVEGAPPTSTAVTAAEGTTEEVALEVPSVVAKVEPTAAPRGPLLRTTGLVVSGTGVLALGVGGALALLAKSKADGASCNVNNVCATSADVEQRHAAVQQANVATVFVVVGAALGVGGAVLWLAAPSGKADAAKPGVTGVGVAPSGLVVGGQF
jgi:hypothetical protein